MNLGWRLSFAIGAVLGLIILFLRRSIPESPRWLMIHGRPEEAERIVDDIEAQVERNVGGDSLEEPEGSITIRQRDRTSPVEVAQRTLSGGVFCFPLRSAASRMDCAGMGAGWWREIEHANSSSPRGNWVWKSNPTRRVSPLSTGATAGSDLRGWI